MNQQSEINKLEKEIASFNAQISSLEAEKAELLAPSAVEGLNPSAPSGNSPADIARVARIQALRSTEIKPHVEGIDSAIALLLDEIRDRQRQVKSHRAQIEREEQQRQLEEAEQAYLEQGEKVRELSIQMEAELKATFISAVKASNLGSSTARESLQFLKMDIPTFTRQLAPTGQAVGHPRILFRTVDLNQEEQSHVV